MRSATTLASVALVSALTGTLLLAGSPGAPGAGAQSLSAHDRALAAYNRMSVRERVGQLFMSGVTTTGATSSERHDLDRVAAGNVYLREGSSASVATIAKRVHTMRSDRTYARVRPFVATDQEGGLVQRLKGSGFDTIPSALAQGRWGPKTLRARAQRWGGQLRSAGLTMDLAPVGDVVPAKNAHRNQPIGRYDREYGHTPLRAGRHVASFTRGMSAAGIATTVKHFPGLGRATGNTDTERRVTDPTTAHDPYLASFEHGIKADEPEYTKHPSTWLNGECWNDEYPNAASVPRKGAHGRLLDNLAEIVAGEDARGARPAHPPALVDQRGARSRH